MSSIWFALRSLLARRLSYGLVFLEMVIGFISLMLVVGTGSDMLAVAWRAQAAGPSDLRVTVAWHCPHDRLAQAVGDWRRSPGVGGVGFIYDMGEWNGHHFIGLDGGTAEAVPLKVADGRWFESADFGHQTKSIPVVVGSSTFPDITIGGSLPGYEKNLVVIGRLRPGQHSWIGNGRTLEAIVQTDSLILTTHALEQENWERLPGYQGRMARLLTLPGKVPAVGFTSIMERDGVLSCLTGDETLGQAVAQYYQSRRPQLFTAAFVSLVIFSIGTLGAVGTTMVALDRRRREFAIRLAVGATTAALARQVMWELLALSLCAALVGIPLGDLAGAALELHVSAPQMVAVAAFGLIMGLLAAVGPMVSIMRRPPVAFIHNGR